MRYVDVHAHLDHPRFEKDLDKVIENAKNKGVDFIITSGVNPSTNKRVLDIADKYDIVRVSFGIYPIDALAKEVESSDEFLREVEEFDIDEALEWIRQNKDKCVAIGECGLDYNWKEFQTEDIREKQKEVFRKVIKLAEEIDKPLIVHTRKAEADVIEILKNTKAKVVLHCFSGKKSLIKQGVELGFYFSVPPIITRLQHFQTLVDIVPLEQLLTETDAPWLSPVAGERNTSSNVSITIKEIAKIKQLDEEDVARVIFNNAVDLFKL